MAITENDVRLYASERMTDFTDGGGRMAATVIVDGLDNNVFPDVTDIDRLSGRASLRKVFGAVVSADTDTYLSAHALLDDAPDDSAVDAILWKIQQQVWDLERADVIPFIAPSATQTGAIVDQLTPSVGFTDVAAAVTAGNAVVPLTTVTGLQNVAAGATVSILLGGIYYLRSVVSVTISSATAASVTLDAAIPVSGAGRLYRQGSTTTGGDSPFGVAATTVAATAGATSLTVGRVWARVVPVDLAAPYPSYGNAQWLNANPMGHVLNHGQVQILRGGDSLLIHSTISMAPAAYPVSATAVSTGRTNLTRLRVIGSNGVEHARFTLGVPAPTGVGCTADLAAGTVTFTDVSGMSMNVTIEHRIEEMVLATAVSVGSGVITLNRALVRDFPLGTKVSSMYMIGDLQGRVSEGFPQSAWTGVFSNTVLGGTPTADFNETVFPITTTNAGAIPDRWALIFTNTTTFRCIGETVGEISGGSTGAEYSPINPATGAPYFTIPLLGWGVGWSAGNVYRFNTSSANAPFWVQRTVAPSAPSPATDSVTVEFRGYVNT